MLDIFPGKRATAAGWVPLAGADSFADSLKMALKPGGGSRGRGRGGPPGGRGKGGLGDLFSGGFKPNPGALRGARGGRGGLL